MPSTGSSGRTACPLGPETISGAIVSQNGKDISAAIWGRPAVLLFHPNSHGQVSIYDLTDDGTPTGEPGHGFSQIISGPDHRVRPPAGRE